MSDRRLIAEWEPQSGILLAWPDDHTDWAPRLAQARQDYVRLLSAILECEPACLLVRDAEQLDGARALLAQNGVRVERLRFAVVEYDDTWIRDYGPLTVAGHEGPGLLDFRFDGWGGKFDARRDDAATGALHRAGCFGDTLLERLNLVLEGGAIDADGAGTILTTAACWRTRHPGLSRGRVESLLADRLGTRRVIWLENGGLAGDDTDSHVDILARFLDRDTIAFQSCDDGADENHESLDALRRELAGLRTSQGRPYRLVPLPWPGSLSYGGRRVPASYANFLFVNGALLMPAFGVAADAEALACLRAALPDREVMAVPCPTLIWQNGGLHCATMQVHEPVPLNGMD